ncbi:MAG: hypothetical protein ABIP30_08215 [Ferruginibacter sp.]
MHNHLSFLKAIKLSYSGEFFKVVTYWRRDSSQSSLPSLWGTKRSLIIKKIINGAATYMNTE